MLLNRGYNANKLIDWLEQVNTEVVIGSKKNRFVERLIDENLYKDSKKVKRYFNNLKQYRRVATRYEKDGSELRRVCLYSFGFDFVSIIVNTP